MDQCFNRIVVPIEAGRQAGRSLRSFQSCSSRHPACGNGFVELPQPEGVKWVSEWWAGRLFTRSLWPGLMEAVEGWAPISGIVC